MKPHKHARLIKAWADGAEIEFLTSFHIPGPGGGTCFTEWKSKSHDSWHEQNQYRIKPVPKPVPKPDVVEFYVQSPGISLRLDGADYEWVSEDGKKCHQIKIVWDGETGEIKSAEALK